MKDIRKYSLIFKEKSLFSNSKLMDLCDQHFINKSIQINSSKYFGRYLRPKNLIILDTPDQIPSHKISLIKSFDNKFNNMLNHFKYVDPALRKRNSMMEFRNNLIKNNSPLTFKHQTKRSSNTKENSFTHNNPLQRIGKFIQDKYQDSNLNSLQINSISTCELNKESKEQRKFQIRNINILPKSSLRKNENFEKLYKCGLSINEPISDISADNLWKEKVIKLENQIQNRELKKHVLKKYQKLNLRFILSKNFAFK